MEFASANVSLHATWIFVGYLGNVSHSQGFLMIKIAGVRGHRNMAELVVPSKKHPPKLLTSIETMVIAKKKTQCIQPVDQIRP